MTQLVPEPPLPPPPAAAAALPRREPPGAGGRVAGGRRGHGVGGAEGRRRAARRAAQRRPVVDVDEVAAVLRAAPLAPVPLPQEELQLPRVLPPLPLDRRRDPLRVDVLQIYVQSFK